MQLIFASNNKHKIEEIKLLLPKTIEILSLHDIGCYDDIPETADTIEGNAILKANYVTQKYGLNCFADDSGLEVNFLNGQPGVHSARYAGNQRNDYENIQKLLLELKNQSHRTANFKTVICLNLNGTQNQFTGKINGTIAHEPNGNNGFGYDPIFIPDGYHITFAQMEQVQKTNISHRGLAMAKLIEFLKNQS